VKKTIIVIGLIAIVSLAAGAVYWQRARSRTRRLDEARALIDTRQGHELLEQLAVQYPNDPEVLLLRTRALRMRNQIEPAIQSLKRAEEFGGQRPTIERERLLLQARTDFRRAEPQLQALLDRNPDDPEVLLALALAWTQSRSYKKAEALAKAILERDPDDGFALCLAGRLQFLQHAPFDAKPNLEKAFAHGADRYYYADARIMLAQCLLEIGSFSEAMELYRQCRAEEPENARVLLGLGRCQWFLGQWQEATAIFETLLRLHPDHLDALSQLAYIHEERGEKHQALELLERAAKQDPTWDELHFRMAKILLALGQKDRAAVSLKHAEDLKQHWAKPRTGPANARNPYTGDDSTPQAERGHNGSS
jgi:tetratricopeptide (TPR) repeat protein